MFVFWLFWLTWIVAAAAQALAANNEPPAVRYSAALVLVLLALLSFAVDRGSKVKAEFQVMTFDGTLDQADLWAEFRSKHEHCSHTGCSDRNPVGCGFAKVRGSSGALPIARGRGNALRGESSAFHWLLERCNAPSDGAIAVLFQDEMTGRFRWMVGARCATIVS